MRVCTAFNRLLRLPGASVIDVSFGSEGVIVTVRLRRRLQSDPSDQLTGPLQGQNDLPVIGAVAQVSTSRNSRFADLTMRVG